MVVVTIGLNKWKCVLNQAVYSLIKELDMWTGKVGDIETQPQFWVLLHFIYTSLKLKYLLFLLERIISEDI